MPKMSKTQCWDTIEDRLMTISETRLGRHVGEAKLAVAVLISAGRDNDVEWLSSNEFSFYCKLAALHEKPTKMIIMRTLEYIKTGLGANFKKADVDANGD